MGGDGAKYLELPEQDICKFYLNTSSLVKTAQYFGYDILTVKKVLYKNNITILTATEATKVIRSKAVLKIDKITGDILETYPSVRAAEAANGNSRHIAQVCNGKRKSAAGYFWKYL